MPPGTIDMPGIPFAANWKGESPCCGLPADGPNEKPRGAMPGIIGNGDGIPTFALMVFGNKLPLHDGIPGFAVGGMNP